ncbi:MAG: hypothetical protein JMN25_16310 [gamma proteobacterium endosymbiont of Lamellibrachia anaximandri]|nr:hypothetical protein [gamma proteobacterium endosymbiont of Lamellibrachia anaximandri]
MSSQNGFRKFKEWKQKLLQSRDIDIPDSRSLYQYRLTTAEFDELEDLLRHWLGLLSVVDLGTFTRITGFPELFVLYASEWWRRRYDGSGFAWEPILRDLNVDPNGWTPGQRSDCVREGLREWHLKPRESGALRFLGAVAVQGGLPLRLLAEAKGGIGHVLHRVLQLAEGRQVSCLDLHAWIESLQGWLPKSYRQAAIYALLADIVWTVLALKQEAGLTAKDDALVVLNLRVPGWKERFPLPLEDKYARGLMEQLVKDAAQVRTRKIAPSLPVERLLESQGGEWVLISRIELPDTLGERELANLFGVSEEALPRAARLTLVVGERSFATDMRRLAGQGCYRIEPASWSLVGEKSAPEHLLRLSAPDGRVWSVVAQRGGAIDEGLPWVFSGDESPHRLLRQGGGGIAATEALLALPQGWRVVAANDGEAHDLGRLEAPAREVVRLRGTVEIMRSDGSALRLRTGQAGARESHFAWSGDRLWLDFVSPSQAYRGVPQLYRIEEEGGRSQVNGQPACSVSGAPNSRKELGPVVLRYPAKGEFKLRSRMVLLPPEAELSVDARDGASGVLRFSRWGINMARALCADVSQQIRQEDEELMLDLAVKQGERAPQWIEIELGWAHTTTLIRLRAPFPAGGVRAFDGKGHELQSGARIALRELLGVRLVANYGDGQGNMALRIGLSHRNSSRNYRLQTLPGSLSLEVSISEYLSDIRQLLSMDDSPDAWVKLALLVRGQEQFILHVARYAAVLERDASHVFIEGSQLQWLSTDRLAGLPVLAMRLEHPEDEPLLLQACSSEGVATGSWDFESEKREPGSWLIYPGLEAEFLFRPTLWPIAGESSAQSELGRAISISEPVARTDSIDGVIASMAADFQHPSWEMVEQLAKEIGHLPLPTLDLWRGFGHSFEGMAAMAFRMSNLPRGFYLRFAEELPFSWDVVSFDAWRSAFEQLLKQCVGLYGEEAGGMIFSNQLDKIKKELWGVCGALNYLLGIVSAGFDDHAAKEAALLRAIGATASQDLFDGADSLLMSLRRCHANDDWPSRFNDILRIVQNDPEVTRYLCPESFGYHDGVINMPLLTAAMVALNRTRELFAEPQNMHLLRTFRSFDPDWFDGAYNLTVKRCLVDGIFDE